MDYKYFHQKRNGDLYKKVDIFRSVSNQLKRKRKLSSKPREINSLKFDGMYITSLAVSVATLQLLTRGSQSQVEDACGIKLKIYRGVSLRIMEILSNGTTEYVLSK